MTKDQILQILLQMPEEEEVLEMIRAIQKEASPETREAINELLKNYKG